MSTLSIRYEYKADKLSALTPENLEKQLNEKGKLGWQLASIHRIGYNFSVIFMREVINEEKE